MAEEEVIEEVVEEVVENKDWFPEDWRTPLAGDDEKSLKQLERYKTPADIWTKARALEQRISSGELKETSAFPAEGTDEEKSAWRALNNVPEASDAYTLTRDLEKPEKEQLQAFFDYAHSNNMSNDSVNAMVDYFFDKLESDENAAVDADKARSQATEDALRAEWGNEYRAHTNRIEGLMDLVPDGAGKDLMEARMADGSMLKDNVAVQQFLLDMAISFNPAGTLVGGRGDVISSIEDEINSIKDVMRTDRAKYNKDEAMQKRYRELLTALEKNKQRTGAAA
jgi:hypothetical protein